MIDSLFGTGQTGGAQLTPPATAALGPEAGGAAPEASLNIAEAPPVKAVLAGEPPALWASTEEPNLGALFVSENLPALGQLGLGLYRGKDRVVLFNQQMLPPEKIKALDAAGQLDSISAPIDSLLGAASPAPGPGVSGAPAGAGAAGNALPASAPAPAPAPAPPVAPAGPQAAAMRIQQLQPKTPSERPLPGQGVVINGLMRRAA
jgi:hypothetical protein